MEVAQDQAALVAKGKRTKRLRLQSPIPFAITNNSSSPDEGGGFVDDHDCDFVADHENYVHNTNFSPTTPLTELQYTTEEEEEEDMANCLILLAQGRSLPSPKHVDDVKYVTVPFQLNNRRLPEAAAAGCYAYECKTCYRTFSSFQALGGHRASHKKPKALAMDEKKNFLSSDDEEIQFKNNITQPLSLQLNNQRGNLYSSGKSKVHECAICGAEFSSGQALGGHMRRHRAMPTATNTALSLTPMAMETEDQRQPKKQRSMISLDLDLNLPAPQDHDQRESKFLIKSNQHQQQQPQQQQHNKQQQTLVFSPGTLVDCHY